MEDREENAVIVNAIQRRSTVVVQKSIADRHTPRTPAKLNTSSQIPAMVWMFTRRRPLRPSEQHLGGESLRVVRWLHGIDE